MKLNHQSEKYSEKINQSEIIYIVPKIVVVLICKPGLQHQSILKQ